MTPNTLAEGAEAMKKLRSEGKLLWNEQRGPERSVKGMGCVSVNVRFFAVEMHLDFVLIYAELKDLSKIFCGLHLQTQMKKTFILNRPSPSIYLSAGLSRECFQSFQHHNATLERDFK